MTVDDYRRQVEEVLRGQRWIIAMDVLAGATHLVDRLHDLGCSVLVVAGTTGTGPLPDPAKCEHFLLNTSGPTTMAGMRAFQAAVADPPSGLQDAVDVWDPQRTAQVLANFLNSTEPLCGRSVFGARLPEWVALEDKIVADQLWKDSAIPRPPSRIVEANDEAAIVGAVGKLGTAEGAVITGDNREGWHGGAEYTRYLKPGADPGATIEFFAAHCDVVRVTPFLSGVPCSVHGFVVNEEVVAFRPVEMLVFRRPDSDRFFYSALGTVWDPTPDRRGEMQDVAKRVGELLRDRVDYRGAFGIDGVMTSAGFLPTELNSRFSSGLQVQAKAADDFPLEDLNRLLIARHPIDIEAHELASLVTSGADARRTARCLTPIDHFEVDETTEVELAWTGQEWEVVTDGESDALLRKGPSAQGALIMCTLTDNHRIPPGSSFAPLAAKVFALTDQKWDTRIGPLVPGFESIS